MVSKDTALKTSPAELRASLSVACPYCGEYFDLFEEDHDGVFFKIIFNNHWDQITGMEWDCPLCAKEISISEVEW